MVVLLDGNMKKIDNDFACVAPSAMEGGGYLNGNYYI